MIGNRSIFFAGGGTGGHIYPAVAVGEQILRLGRDTEIHFFGSERDIDTRVLSKTELSYTRLAAKKFSLCPIGFFSFLGSFLSSYKTARERIAKSDNPIVVGIGGFVSVPVCWAAHKLGV